MNVFTSYLLTFACADYSWSQPIVSTRSIRAITNEYTNYLEAGETLTVEMVEEAVAS